MPTYAYRCSDCDHTFDAVQRFSDDALTECPECQGQIRRVFHATPIVFKGSGWYITDSRAKDTSTDSTSTATSDNDNGSKPAKSSSETAKGTSDKAATTESANGKGSATKSSSNANAAN